MSVKRFLDIDSATKVVDTVFPNQGDRVQTDLVAPPIYDHYQDAGFIGTAYDYLLRFHLETHTKNVDASDWRAEMGLMALKSDNSLPDQFGPDFGDDTPIDVEAAEAAFARAKRVYDDYISTGEISTELLEAALDLARFDAIYRGPTRTEGMFGEYRQDHLNDLRAQMLALTKSTVFNGETAYLNPTFGAASVLIGGADADVILDDRLIDVKTSKYAEFKPDYWRQLVVYCVLADIHRTLRAEDSTGADYYSDKPLAEIESFGVYFSRYDALQAYPSEMVYDHDEYEAFRAWFIETALANIGDHYLYEIQSDGPVLDEVLLPAFCDGYDTDTFEARILGRA